MAVVAGPVRAMATSHADAARSVPVVRAHARMIPCGTPRAAIAVDDGVRAETGFASPAGDGRVPSDVPYMQLVGLVSTVVSAFGECYVV